MLLYFGVELVYQHTDDRTTVAIVGARAEAMMPDFIWGRVQKRFPKQSFIFQMIGDDVPKRSAKVPKIWPESTPCERITLQYISQLYHHQAQRSVPHAFALFHPGFGHAHLRERWRPSVQMLLCAKKPIMLTSFSKQDQERDLDALVKLAQPNALRIHSYENAFPSLKWDVDPQDLLHPIQANKYVTLVHVV